MMGILVNILDFSLYFLDFNMKCEKVGLIQFFNIHIDHTNCLILVYFTAYYYADSGDHLIHGLLESLLHDTCANILQRFGKFPFS